MSFLSFFKIKIEAPKAAAADDELKRIELMILFVCVVCIVLSCLVLSCLVLYCTLSPNAAAS